MITKNMVVTFLNTKIPIMCESLEEIPQNATNKFATKFIGFTTILHP
jgi:hypothetical protein